MARFTLDPDRPPKLSDEEKRRLEMMSDEAIGAAAKADADNQPMTDEELGKLRTARAVRRARHRSGLSQTAFARTYRINVARLRDLEQGRTKADSALLAYLAVIENDPEAVRRTLKERTVTVG
jgi:putative transcriptional regulator